MNSNARLQLPPGSAGLFLEEAAGHQAAIERTNSLFAGWGYTMVHTPMIDFYDAHRHLIGPEDEKRLYRLIGRDGEVLMLRFDITMFLLKHLNSLLKQARFPVRLSYSDSILRHEDSIDISRREHYQAGAELIGADTRDGDLEILLLMCEHLESLGQTDAAIHLGSRTLFDRCFPNLGSQAGSELSRALLSRDWDEFDRILAGGQGAPDALLSPEETRRLFSSIARVSPDAADRSEAQRLQTLAGGHETLIAELNYLEQLAQAVAEHFPGFSIRIDPSEIGGWAYYSGLFFSAYVPNMPSPLASGGRYDRLLQHLGMDAKAVGYQLMLSALPSTPGTNEPIISLSGVRQEGQAPNEDILLRYKKARELRSQGKRVSL